MCHDECYQNKTQLQRDRIRRPYPLPHDVGGLL